MENVEFDISQLPELLNGSKSTILFTDNGFLLVGDNESLTRNMAGALENEEVARRVWNGLVSNGITKSHFACESSSGKQPSENQDPENAKEGKFCDFSLEELELLHLLLREYGPKGRHSGYVNDDLQSQIYKELIYKRLQRLGEDPDGTRDESAEAIEDLSPEEVESLAQRIVDRFYAGEDVSEEAWEYADTLDIGQSTDFFDLYLNPEPDEAIDYLREDDFDSEEPVEEDDDEDDEDDDDDEDEEDDEDGGRYLQIQHGSEMTDEEYKKAKERYFKSRFESGQPSYRFYSREISDSGGRSVVVVIKENPLLEWVEVTVHSSFSEVQSSYAEEGEILT